MTQNNSIIPKRKSGLSGLNQMTQHAQNLENMILGENNPSPENTETLGKKNDENTGSSFPEVEIHTEQNEVLEKDENTGKYKSLNDFLSKKDKMKHEKTDTVNIVSSHKEKLKLLATVKGSNINTILYNLIDNFITQYDAEIKKAIKSAL